MNFCVETDFPCEIFCASRKFDPFPLSLRGPSAAMPPSTLLHGAHRWRAFQSPAAPLEKPRFVAPLAALRH
jgi:hypothetical protein